MAVRKKPTAKTPDGTPVAELAPTAQLAYRLIEQYNDLAPSVQRIMGEKDLDEEQRHAALTAFQASLSGVGDPNRDPRVAIANARAGRLSTTS